MMMMNPIYERERRASSRRGRLPAFLALFNGFLAAVAMFAVIMTFRQMDKTGQISYASFLQIFRALGWILFTFVAAVMPALTAGSISGERERRTLDLILATRMKPADIVLGKLASAMAVVLVMLLSSLPVFMAVLMYGGVRLRDFAAPAGCILLTALLGGSAGIFFSAVCRRTATAAAMAYGAEMVLLLGPFGLYYLMQGIASAPEGLRWFLVSSPVTLFSASASGITGERIRISELFAGVRGGLLSSRLFFGGCLFQLLLCIGFLAAAAVLISPLRKRPRGLFLKEKF